ncbi:AlbA family DNA-binding domain-containing protein, partial [Kribbella sp. NPDC002412]
MRIPRLELLLGCRLGDLAWDRLISLIDEGLSEEQTLDFKSELYRGNDKGKYSLASDMAAFANSAGGMVILGVTDTDGRATDVPGVDITDAERVRMVKILVDNVTPVLPDLTIGSLPHPEDPTRGVYLLVVPPSDAAPHGVRRAAAAAEDHHVLVRGDPADL